MGKTTLVFSIAVNGYDKLFASCVKTHDEYCNRCGYEYILIDRAPRSLLATEAAWLKVVLLKAALESGYEWVAFIDADCEIRPHAPPFESLFLEKTENQSVLMAHGFSGRFNSGVIFIRNTQGSIDFFTTVIDNADCEIPPKDSAPYENGHMIHFGKNNPTVGVIDYSWNNNRKLNESSYIQHYSGGILRKWYMENRAPSTYLQSKTKRKQDLLQALFATFTRRVTRLLRRTKVFHSDNLRVSTSISELLPFYEDNYTAFNTGASGA